MYICQSVMPAKCVSAHTPAFRPNKNDRPSGLGQIFKKYIDIWSPPSSGTGRWSIKNVYFELALCFLVVITDSLSARTTSLTLFNGIWGLSVENCHMMNFTLHLYDLAVWGIKNYLLCHDWAANKEENFYNGMPPCLMATRGLL